MTHVSASGLRARTSPWPPHRRNQQHVNRNDAHAERALLKNDRARPQRMIRGGHLGSQRPVPCGHDGVGRSELDDCSSRAQPAVSMRREHDGRLLRTGPITPIPAGQAVRRGDRQHARHDQRSRARHASHAMPPTTVRKHEGPDLFQEIRPSRSARPVQATRSLQLCALHQLSASSCGAEPSCPSPASPRRRSCRAARPCR